MSGIATEVPLKDPQLFRQACYIDGTSVGAQPGEEIKVDDPATGEVIGKIPRLGTAQTRQAIDAAARAFPARRKRTAIERASVLRRWFDLMMSNQEDLAHLMTLEQGKPLAEARGEVAYAASFLEWFGEEAKRIYGDTIPAHQVDKRIAVIKYGLRDLRRHGRASGRAMHDQLRTKWRTPSAVCAGAFLRSPNVSTF